MKLMIMVLMMIVTISVTISVTIALAIPINWTALRSITALIVAVEQTAMVIRR